MLARERDTGHTVVRREKETVVSSCIRYTTGCVWNVSVRKVEGETGKHKW